MATLFQVTHGLREISMIRWARKLVKLTTETLCMLLLIMLKFFKSSHILDSGNKSRRGTMPQAFYGLQHGSHWTLLRNICSTSNLEENEIFYNCNSEGVGNALMIKIHHESLYKKANTMMNLFLWNCSSSIVTAKIQQKILFWGIIQIFQISNLVTLSYYIEKTPYFYVFLSKW